MGFCKKRGSPESAVAAGLPARRRAAAAATAVEFPADPEPAFKHVYGFRTEWDWLIFVAFSVYIFSSKFLCINYRTSEKALSLSS